MDATLKFWRMCRLGSGDAGYETHVLPSAKSFLSELGFAIEGLLAKDLKTLQVTLLGCFRNAQSQQPIDTCVLAGFCLRCRISHTTLQACRKLANLFGSNRQFTYRDLLPFVLNDDGETAVVLGEDGKTQLKVTANGDTRPNPFRFFAVDVLQTFDRDSDRSTSLDSWVFLQAKQQPELKRFLSEFGFKHLSDWALMNRASSSQIDRLSQRDRHLLESFHAVYRRDRRAQSSRSARRCPDPNDAQLREMMQVLKRADIVYAVPTKLLGDLKQVADQLREYDLWQSRESLEYFDRQSEDYSARTDLPYESLDEQAAEEQEFLAFIEQTLQESLTAAIARSLDARQEKLAKSRKYKLFADKYLEGLQRYYRDSLSLKDIAPQLGMTSWDQARRVLNPGDLLNQVRAIANQRLLDAVLARAYESGLTTLPPNPDYLQTLARTLEAFADEQVFDAAAAELRAGSHRSMTSPYAQLLLSEIDSRTQV